MSETPVIYRRRIPWNPVSTERPMPLGRHVAHDPRSKAHPADRAQKIVSVTHASEGLPLNQADVGSCTGEALTAAGNSAPNLKPEQKPRTQNDAYAVYHEETILERDPWPPNDPGGSGLYVCRAGKRMGWIKSYRHAFGLQHGLEALVIRPAMFGVNWYDSFDRPDPQTGVIDLKPGASIRGGHEICALRIIAEHELVGFAQSWGPQYGVPDPEMGLPHGGAFYIPFSILERLLEEQGDCTVPVFA